MIPKFEICTVITVEDGVVSVLFNNCAFEY